MPTSDPDQVKIRCECGAGLRLPAKALGRKVKCPKCQRAFVATSGEHPASAAAPADDLSSMMQELAAAEKKSAAVAQPDRASSAPAPTACPLCGKPLEAGAVLCTGCGYDARTGRRLSSAKVSVPVAARFAKLAGTFLFGCVLSAIGAGIGAILWVVIAAVTMCEIGWIAWGLGALAGTGMALGYRRYTPRAGAVAAIIAALAILASKAAVFVLVLYIVATGDTDNVGMQRLLVTDRLANEHLDQRGVHDEKARQDQWEDAWKSAEKKVAKMSDQEVRSRAESYREAVTKDAERFTDTGLLRSRLVAHEAELEAEREGLAWNNPKRARLYERHERKMDEVPESELKSREAALDAWEKEGRWADETYVRHHLIFAYVEESLREEPPTGVDAELDPEEWEVPGDVWKQRYDEAVADVDAMAPAPRVEELKKIELTAEDERMRVRLTWHFAERAAERAGLAFSEVEAREALQEEQQKKFASYSHEQLVSEAAALDAWEKDGQWTDAEYLRDHLIFSLADEAVRARRKERKGDDEVWTPSAEEWKEFLAKATAQVEQIPPQQHVQRLRDLEAAKQKAMQDFFAERESEESAELASTLVAAFGQSLLAPLNLLFAFLALTSAYRIGSHGFSKE